MNVWIKGFAELIGTMLLVFVGTGSIVTDEVGLTSFEGLGISICFGGIVMLMILLLGKTSGAHLNPAVSLFVWLRRGISNKVFTVYVLMQCIGAILASLILSILFPQSEFLGATLASTTLKSAFMIEWFMTFLLLMLIILLHRWHPHRNFLAAFAIGTLIFLEALLGGPFTGASMNPARSLGPALLSGHLENLWIYLTAPCTASLMAALFFRKKQSQ